MKNTTVMKPRIGISGNRVTTTSLAVAEHFRKEHFNVLRDIRNIINDAPAEFNAFNFEAVEYVDPKGERRPMYRLTRDAFVLIAMGFTGKRALQWKIAYINGFNWMEQQLRKPPTPLEAPMAQPAIALGQHADFFDGPTFNELYRLFNLQYGPAVLVTYLLQKQAHLHWHQDTLRNMARGIGSLARNAVLENAKRLQQQGFLELVRAGGDKSPYRYFLKLDVLKDALAAFALSDAMLPGEGSPCLNQPTAAMRQPSLPWRRKP